MSSGGHMDLFNYYFTSFQVLREYVILHVLKYLLRSIILARNTYENDGQPRIKYNCGCDKP
jgi:hypothetical protein